MHAIRKGQIRWVAKGDPIDQLQIIHSIFGVAASLFPGQHVHQYARLCVPVFATEPADHYATTENGRNPSLFLSRHEQRNALIRQDLLMWCS